jgi:hypothetical protein
LGILFSSILCTCPNQRNLFNPIAVNKHIFKKKKRYENHSETDLFGGRGKTSSL